jgi:prepilin peptidase CpaA
MTVINSSLVCWLVLVMACDLSTRRVPNWTQLVGLALALTALAVQMQPLGIGLGQAVLGAALGFGTLLLCYGLGVMGAGDVKFAGVLGLWFGWQLLLPIWVGASLLAGLHASAVLWMQRLPQGAALIEAAPSGAKPGKSRYLQIPYAAYLAISAWVVMQGV